MSFLKAKKSFLVIIALVFPALAQSAWADSMKGPWDRPAASSPKEVSGRGPGQSGPGGDYALSFYQQWISPLAGGDRCPMYPSCSHYARQSVARHGFLMGIVMTTDRLMRCGRSEKKLAPKVWNGAQWKISDPVENNDFWRSP